MRGQAAGDDVGAVPRGDHQVAVGDPLEEVLQAHRPDDQPAHLAVRARRPAPSVAVDGLQVLRAQRPRDLGDGRRGQDRRLRQGRGDEVVADDLGQPGAHLVDQRGVDAVGHHADQRAAAVAQRREPRRDRVEHLLGRPPAPAHDQQHGAPEVVRGVDVEVELDGERPAVKSLPSTTTTSGATTSAAAVAAASATAVAVTPSPITGARGQASPSASVR